jgi:hypothetical protein
VLNWGFAAGIRCIEACERSQESSDDSNNLSAVWNVGGGLLQNEECGLGIDTNNKAMSVCKHGFRNNACHTQT